MKSRKLATLFSSMATIIAVAALSSPATAALSDWQSEVAAGTPAGYSNVNIASPIVADIGVYDEATGGGVTYEFIVNATDEGVSSALLGTFEDPAPVGERAALKWEQWEDTGALGTTAFGVADNTVTDDGTPTGTPVLHTPGVDTHLVFVNNAVDTLVYLNGSLAGMVNGSALNISGTVGIGGAYNPAGDPIDPLTGTIVGVAVYDAALSAEEIAAHAAAYAVIPEPSSLALALGAVGMLALRRRR